MHAAFRDRRLGSTFLHRYTPEELSLPPDVPAWRDPRWTDFHAFERWELLNLEPPVHTRLRRLVLEAFTPRAVEALRTPVAERARALLAPARERGSLDLVDDYAQAFSLGIICDLIGVAPDDRETIKRLSDDTVAMYEPGADDDTRARANAAAGDFRTYLLDVIALRRASGGDDLLAGAARGHGRRRAAHRRPGRLDRDGPADGGARGDGQRDGERRRGARGPPRPVAAAAHRRGHDPRGDRGDPALRPAAPVVRALGARRGRRHRRASRSRPGSRVALVIGAANRDPRRFAEPDRFDIRRTDAAHLSFGGGIHFCIGAPLARLELETTLAELLRTEAELEILPGAARRPTFQFRGWARLPIAIHA